MFLREGVHRQRRIRTVRLDRAYYDEPDGRASWMPDDRHRWADVLGALSCLPYSAGLVQDLSIFVFGISSGTFGGGMVPYARTLERLLIMYRWCGFKTALTFAAERDKQLSWLTEDWDKHTSALRKIAFTAEFAWTKTEKGWQAPPR
ncbi:hypothetical protein TRAPUB_8969 [Trametes pubescens]|uniref:Uncharacterized protein n=1 Tax=Trametes pubescens TaxID=154538 RepID=A0A1M2W3P9_TRAPU|nr:hypothetical protein TRAPUB_8969 [Trametes pubescens]